MTARLEPHRRRRSRRKGTALVLTLVMLLLIGALAASMSLTMQNHASTSVQSRELAASLAQADGGIARAKARLHFEFTDNYLSQVPNLWGMTAGQSYPGWLVAADGTSVDIECVENVIGDHIDYYLTSTSAGPSPRRVQILVRIRYETTPLKGSGAGAIVAFGPVTVSGNFKVDGRDHPDTVQYGDANPTVLPGSGAPSISATGTVEVASGSVDLAGTGPDGTDYDFETKNDVVDGQHFDSNSSVWAPESGDPEASDGVDNDNDGLVDETSGQPTSADDYFGLSAGSLKASAQASGTYFTDVTAYNDYITNNPVSGKVLYLEVANGSSVGQLNLPDNPQPSSDPAIVIVAGTDPTQHDVTVGPIHMNGGLFQGVFVGDFVDKMNGNGSLLGQVVSFNESNLGTIGNGTFDVLLSTEVLGNLPKINGIPGNVVEDVQMWRELSPP